MAYKYWVGATGNWNDTANWSLTSGGAGGAGVPTLSDEAYFDPSGGTWGVGNTCTVDINATVGVLWLTTLSAGTVNLNGKTITLKTLVMDGVANILTSNGATLDFSTPDTGYIDLHVSSTRNLADLNVTVGGSFNFTGFDMGGTNINSIIVNTSGNMYIGNVTVNIVEFIAYNEMGFTGTVVLQDNIFFPDNGILSIYAGVNSLKNLTLGVNSEIIIRSSVTISSLTMGNNYKISIWDSIELIVDLLTLNSQTGDNNIITSASGKGFLTLNNDIVSTDYLYVTNVTLLGGTMFYAGNNSTQGVGAVGFIFGGIPDVEDKQFFAVIYDNSGNIISRLINIVNIPSIVITKNKINNMVFIKLAMNVAEELDEENTITFGNVVKIYVKGKQYPDGVVYYTGFIDSYVVEYEKELVIVNLLSFDSTLNDYLIKPLGTTFDSDLAVGVDSGDWIGLTSEAVDAKGLGNYGVYFTIQTDGTTTSLLSMIMRIRTVYTTNGVNVTMYLYTTEAAAKDFADNSYIAKVIKNVSSTSFSEVSFLLNLTVAINTTYHVRIESGDLVQLDASGVGTTTARYKNELWVGAWQAPDNTIWFEAVSENTNTTVAFSLKDPAEILRDTIDSMIQQGGSINYTSSSIDTVGAIYSYTFNTNSILEVLDKIVSLAGEDWYWYVESKNNTIHLHKNNSDIISHNLQIGREIISLNIAKKSGNIVSDVYLSGGDTGGGAHLYNRYTNDSTTKNYMYRAKRVIDGRVTQSSTANQIAQTELAHGASPNVIAICTVVDDISSEQGYDIESFKLGQYIRINSMKNNDASSLWDMAVFDVDYFDYKLSKLNTLPLQIISIKWHFDTVQLTLGAEQDNYFSTIENISKRVKLLESSNNPSIPT